MKEVQAQLSFLGPELTDDLIAHSNVVEVPAGTELIKDDQYVKVLPIVLRGLVKVFSRFEERELLLYYIQPRQSCVMSFAAVLQNRPSRIFAVTEEASSILLLPGSKISSWLQKYPSFSQLFYEQYDLRYAELLDTIEHILINKMDKRLHDYLLEKSKVLNQNEIRISHSQIANELGTAREVVTRMMKKLEIEGKVEQLSNSIKILTR